MIGVKNVSTSKSSYLSECAWACVGVGKGLLVVSSDLGVVLKFLENETSPFAFCKFLSLHS